MKNKIKKILISGILSLVLVFAFAFASLNVLRTNDRAHAVDPFEVDFKSSSGEYDDYNDATITETTTFADIVTTIKSENNLSLGDTITFYFCFKNPDTELQMIDKNQFDYNSTEVLDVFNFYGAGPSTYGNYYFRYEVVIASPSNDPGVPQQEEDDVVDYTCKGSYDSINYDLVYNLSLDASETTLGTLRQQLKYAVENQFDHWSVSEIKLFVDNAKHGNSADFQEITTNNNSNYVNNTYTQSDIIYFGITTVSEPPRQFTGNLGDIQYDFEYSFVEDVEISDVRETLSSHLSDNEYVVVVTSLSYGGEELADDAEIGSRGCNTVHPFTYTATKTPKQSEPDPVPQDEPNPQQEQQSQKLIEFTPVVTFGGNYTQVTTDDTLLLEGNETNLQVTVQYKVVSNTGINNLVLIPTYDTTVFSIANNGVTPNNETALGEATVTGNETDASVVKVAWDSKTTFLDYSQENDEVVLLTVVYTFDAEDATDGASYAFGLKVENTEQSETYNDKSTAHVYEAGKTGEQEAVEIALVLDETTPENVVKILKKQDAHITIGYNNSNPFEYRWVYSKTDIPTEQVETLNNSNDYKVTYTYDGTAEDEDIIVEWYITTAAAEAPSDTAIDYTNSDHNAPWEAGVYFVKVTAPAHGVYRSASAYRKVYINPLAYHISVDEKSSEYGDDIVPLTFHLVDGQQSTGEALASGTPIGSLEGLLSGDTMTITLSTTASKTAVGEYDITVSTNNSNYQVSDIGLYTVTQKTIIITVKNQHHTYDGTAPVSQELGVAYEVSGVDNISNYITDAGVVINRENPTNYNVGQYALTAQATLLDDTNYVLSTNYNAKYYIDSAGLEADYVFSFFTGKTVTYNSVEQDLLEVKETNANSQQFPLWLSNKYTASNNKQTNAGDYTITVTIDNQTAINYTGVTTGLQRTFNAEITKANLTITAEDKESYYGESSVNLSSTFDGKYASDTITVTYYDQEAGQGNIFTITSGTDAGEYTIYPYAENANYNITLVPGTYTVKKVNPVISVTANDVDYNQPLSYTVSVTYLENTINNYTLSVGADELPLDSVLDADDYTLTVTVPAGTNYNAGSGSDTFTVNPVKLGTPGLSYVNGTVTWTAPTEDKYGNELLGAHTFTYKINNETQSGNSYTAGSTAALTLKVTPSNTNYAVTEFTLKDVYVVTFASEEVDPYFGDPTGLPETQYIFDECFVAAPQANPTRTGYSFKAWDPALTTAITANKTIYATWNIVKYTITVVYPVNYSTTETRTKEVNHGTELTTSVAYLCNLVNAETEPAQTYNLAGLKYEFKGTWNYKVTGTEEVLATGLGSSSDPVTALGNYTFTAEYNTTPLPFTLTYMVSTDGGAYVQYKEEVEIDFGTEIDYETLSPLNWFRVEAWFENAARTVLAPVTMPAKHITVYGSYVFDIGTGDVNANKEVTTNDITLYRQWIVGGYTMTELTTDDAILTAAQAETTQATETRYFLYRVADVNGDGSRDIRDVSTIRMTIATGYGWEDENGYNVSGHEVIRNVKTKTFSEVSTALEAGKKVTLSDDVTEADGQLLVNYAGHVTLDLGGHTLTVAKVDLTVTNRGTLTVKNGTIVTTQGITLRAPYGNVVIDGVTGYDKDGVVNLQAAQNSLHLAGLVRFFEGVDTTVTTTPAAVNVEEGTHVVIEAAAELVVEKLVVTHDVFQTTSTVETLTIALNNYSAAVETVVVENGSVKNDNLIYTYEDLVNAGNRDGLYTLMADIDCGSNDVVYNNVNVVLDLNRHNITFASWGFEANLGASLTINGLGTVTAGKACLYSRRNSELVINGGNYVSNDHYVIGTNGNSDQGVSHIVINGGTFTSYITTANKIPCGIYLANNDTLEVNGGTFNIENGVGILARAGHTTVSDKAVFNVTGNGTFGQAGDSKVNIPSGSVLVLDYAANYPAGDPVITNKSTYKVVAVVESEADLNSAVAVADEVVLLADINLSTTVAVKTTVTLDLNGHTLYNTTDIWSDDNWSLVSVREGGNLTINGNGTLQAKANDCYAVDVCDGATLTINGGNYVGNVSAVYVLEGTANINGGHFSIQQLYPDYRYMLNLYDANREAGTAVIVVTGGTFENFNPADNLAEGQNTNFVAEGYRVVEENGVYTVKLSSLVATAEEFVEFVANGGNVTLENDIDLSAQVEVNKDVVLDLNGHTLRYIGQTTLNSGLLAVRRGATLTINDTVGNGKVDASSNNVYAAVALTLAADGATGEVAKVVVNGGTLEGYYYGVVGNGSRHDTEVVVNDGTLYGINGSGIYNPQDGLVTVNGGNVKGLETAIEIRAGELVINGGEFEALATAYTLTGNGSGTTLTGVIIAVSQHTTLKPITVTINDGTFTNGVCAVALVDTTVNTHSDLINVTINGGTFNSVKSATSRTIYVKNGNLIINGGNYNSGPDNNDEGNSTILVDSYGHVTINGGTFRAGAKWGGRYWTLNKYNNVANTTSLLVCGGTYYEFDPSNPNTDDSVTYLAEGYTVTKVEEVYTVVKQ